MLTALEVGVDEHDIRRLQRLGRKTDSGPPRPILIQLGSRHVKNLIMKSLYKLKSLDSKFKHIIIAHDMTKKQWEECRTLVQEAKDKEQQEGQGEWTYWVRGLSLIHI